MEITTKTKEFTVHIGMGLPGSGKSTYFYKKNGRDGYTDKSGTYHRTIDLDRLMTSYRNYITVNGKLDFKKLFNFSVSPCQDKNIIVIDSLCLDKKTALGYIHKLSELASDDNFSNLYAGNYHIIIDQWREDRKQCLLNDELRDRETKAAVTIEHATYEPFESQEELEKLIKEENLNIASATLVWHDVAVPEDWQIKTRRPGLPQDVRYMKSYRWATGGTWGSWTGASGDITPDQPLENTDLDEFLEQHAPSISMLQYKRILKECVTQETEDESDYYGGTAHYAYWKTDMKRLYELLEEFGIWK